MTKHITGNIYGRLTVIERAGSDRGRRALWLCHCECGSEKVISGSDLRSGHSKSCGCLQRERSSEANKGKIPYNTLPNGEASFRAMFHRYKRVAKKRGYSFELTKDEFRKLTQQNCYYCGSEPRAIAIIPSHNGSYIGNGIDRIDNTESYTPYNCVPCCGTCNLAKLGKSADEFFEWGRQLAARLTLWDEVT